MVVIGGVGTLVGPLIGAIIVTILPEVVRFARDYRIRNSREHKGVDLR
jgi:branched-chain amino acid transport system permease protein